MPQNGIKGLIHFETQNLIVDNKHYYTSKTNSQERTITATHNYRGHTTCFQIEVTWCHVTNYATDNDPSVSNKIKRMVQKTENITTYKNVLPIRPTTALNLSMFQRMEPVSGLGVHNRISRLTV